MQKDPWILLGKAPEAPVELGFAPATGATVDQIEDRIYFSARGQGIACVAPLDRKITSVQLFAPGFQGYQGYADPLPQGLSFSDSRADVHTKLGSPAISGGGGTVPVLGKTTHWDRYDMGDRSLHLRYAPDDKSIDLVTLMSVETAQRVTGKPA